jgi:hypothetical protein
MCHLIEWEEKLLQRVLDCLEVWRVGVKCTKYGMSGLIQLDVGYDVVF